MEAEVENVSNSAFLRAAEVRGDLSALRTGILAPGPRPGSGGDGEVRRVRTTCRACISNCGVIATVKNGRVVKLEGDPKNVMSKGHMCAKGLAGIQALYNPNRNKYPLKRVGARGEGRWRRISWDEALSTIAGTLMDIRETYGAEAVMCSTGGGGNPQFTSVARFCNIFGTPNWFEPGCAQCYLPRMLAYNLIYGGSDPSIADSNSHEIYFPEDTPMKTLCLWGTDPSYSCPAMGGGALVELREKGVKTVVVDPRMTPDAARADVWLPIRPGTDVALQLCWIRYMLAHELYNREFVLKWTNLPYLVDTRTGECLRLGSGDPDVFAVWDRKTGSVRPLRYPWDDSLDVELDGEHVVDGVLYKTGFRLLRERAEPFTLEKAADLCCLLPGKIEEAIRLFCENTPGGLCIGVATDQNPNSVQAAMGAAIIDLLLGNVEQPGSLLQRFAGGGPGLISFADGKLPYEQLVKRLGGNEYKGLHMWHAAHPPTLLHAIETGEPYPIKAWIDRSGNKLAVLPEGEKWVAAMDHLDLIVHMYMYPTSFSAYADILLPTTEWLETNYIERICNTMVCRQAVTHLYETMDECLIWSKLARYCAELGHEGCRKSFDPDYMGRDGAYWETMEELLERTTATVGMTWDEFREKAPVEFLPLEKWKRYYVYQTPDKSGKPRGFPTASKKAELYAEAFLRLGQTGMPFSGQPLPPASKDYDPLPYYLEPAESPRDEAQAKDYPLVMTNGRVPYFHHGTLRNVPWLREMYPVPEVWIHPEDAEKYGIANGDWVWVESRRARVRGMANVTPGIGRGTVYMERFWTPETLHTGTHGWQEMNVNRLSRGSAPFNDVVGTYTLRGYLVRVEPAPEGPPEGVWTSPRDFRAWLPEYSDPTPQYGKEV